MLQPSWKRGTQSSVSEEAAWATVRSEVLFRNPYIEVRDETVIIPGEEKPRHRRPRLQLAIGVRARSLASPRPADHQTRRVTVPDVQTGVKNGGCGTRGELCHSHYLERRP